MFLARAINQLIPKNCHKLDPLVGDEGCQFAHAFYPWTCMNWCRAVKDITFSIDRRPISQRYRQATGEEQAAAIAKMKELEQVRNRHRKKSRIMKKSRIIKKSRIMKKVSKFMASNALRASMAAKSGSYEEDVHPPDDSY